MTDYKDRDKLKYAKNLFGMILIGVGAILNIEHIYFWGSVDFFDFIGHEWLGLFLFLLGWGINLDFDKLKNKVL